MEDEPVHIIREASRNIIKLNRQYVRDKQTDVGRDIERTRVTEETIENIIQKLKSKSITVNELNVLKNSLYYDENCIAKVMSSQGSLRGLVREISGIDATRQLAAAQCFCNLALGDAKACSAIVKSAGPYLTTALDSQSMETAVTAAWAVGNLAASGAKACEALRAQGALAKLAAMLESPHEEIVEAALYALTHFAYQLGDGLSKEYLEKLLPHILELKLRKDSARLLFTLSCHSDFDVSNEDLSKILQWTTVSLEKHCKNCAENKLCCELVFLIRTLANTNMNKTGVVILNYFETNVSVEYYNVVLQSSNTNLAESFTWLLGNIYNYCGDSKLISMLVNG